MTKQEIIAQLEQRRDTYDRNNTFERNAEYARGAIYGINIALDLLRAHMEERRNMTCPIQVLLDSEDDSGCSGDVTVVSKEAIESLRSLYDY